MNLMLTATLMLFKHTLYIFRYIIIYSNMEDNWYSNRVNVLEGNVYADAKMLVYHIHL